MAARIIPKLETTNRNLRSRLVGFMRKFLNLKTSSARD